MNLQFANVPEKIANRNMLHPEIEQLNFITPVTPTNQIGGRLQYFLANWKIVTTDKNILQMVKGLKVEWNPKPSGSITRRGPRFSQQEIDLIAKEVQALLEKNAIAKSTETADQFVGHLFLRPKKDGGMRPIYNMKPINHHVRYEHFKMENLAMVRTTLQQHDFMVKIDLKDAYQCVPIHEWDRKFMKFHFQGQTYEYKSLPFGLASAPRQFTKLMKPVTATLRKLGVRMLVYLDDMILFNQDPEKLMMDMNSLIFLLEKLGLVVNEKKSVKIPTREIEFLGMEINSSTMQLSLPEEKLTAIRKECLMLREKTQVSVMELAKIVGKLVSTVQAVHPAPLYYRELQMLKTKGLIVKKSYSTMVTLTEPCKEELTWWIEHLETWNGNALISAAPDMILQTDASKSGWGAHREGPNNGEGINGLWTPEEAELAINLLELRAAEFGVKAFTKNLSNIHVHLKMDNISALAHINKKGGTRSRQLVDATKNLWEHCLKKGITLTAEYLPGIQNTVADSLSRHYVDWSDWKLEPKYFNKLNNSWGPIKRDLFANRLNHQTTLYFSWKSDPEAVGTDAFLTPWQKGDYAFPPFCQIARCLAKIRKEKTTVILIAPVWQSQYWYPDLLNLAVDQPLLIPTTPQTLMDSQKQPHPLIAKNALHLAAWKLSGQETERKVFLRKLQTSSTADSEQAHKGVTTHVGKNGVAGVMNGVSILFRHM